MWMVVSRSIEKLASFTLSQLNHQNFWWISTWEKVITRAQTEYKWVSLKKSFLQSQLKFVASYVCNSRSSPRHLGNVFGLYATYAIHYNHNWIWYLSRLKKCYYSWSSIMFYRVFSNDLFLLREQKLKHWQKITMPLSFRLGKMLLLLTHNCCLTTVHKFTCKS